MHVIPQRGLLFVALVTVTWSFMNPPPSGLSALPASEARVTRVTNSVEVSHPMRAPHRARLNDIVDQETVVRTGKKRESH